MILNQKDLIEKKKIMVNKNYFYFYIYLIFFVILGDAVVRKSRRWILPLKNFPQQTFEFESTIIDDEVMEVCLRDLKDRVTVFQKDFDYNEILYLFGVLPQAIKSDLNNLVDYQVFMCGIINRKKVEVHYSGNSAIRLELLDVAPAPKGAEYNVSIILPKA